VACDRENEERWKRLGWDVLVLWECQANEREALKQLILGFLPKRF
jgi:G:T-mismatch repair DNA endonuclease (very short patch repair protein)